MMDDATKTREQLLNEIKALKQKLIKSEKLKAKLNDINQQLTASEQQLQAANQQLKATEQQLKAANQQLGANNQQLVASEQQLQAANQQLMESKAIVSKNMALLHAILESPYGMIIFALDKEYQYTAFTSQHKQTMKKIWGVEIKIGMSMLKAIPDIDDREKAKKNFDKALHGEHLVLVEEYGDKHMQRLFWENRYAPVYNEQNEIIGLSVFVIDITERKIAKEELSAKIQQLIANEQQLRAANQQLKATEQQLKAANQQLEAIEQQLRAANQQLEANNQQLAASEQDIKKKEHNLRERVKELNSLYGITESIRIRKTIEEVLQDTADIIPPSWQYPEFTRAKILFDGKEYVSQPFKETVWKQAAELVVKDRVRGSIEVYYLEECPELDEGPFLKEERSLINSISKIISKAIERKQVEDALGESEKKYRTILESIEESYFEVDIAGNFTFFNDSLCRLLGYSKDELMGMNNRQYMDKENAKKVYQTFNMVFQTGKPIEAFDWEFIKKNGERRFTEASSSLMRDTAGKPIGFHGVVKDITKRKKAVEALKESEAKLSTIIEHSPNGIYVIDDNEKVILINEAIVKIVGYPKNEILHQPFKKFIDKENLQLVTERYKKRLSGEKVPSHYEFNIIRKNGEKRIVEISSSSVKEKTGKSIIVAHMEDVTEKRKYEKAQQFLYNISKISLTEISLKNYLGQIHQELKQLMKADNFYIALYDPASGKYSFPYHVDEYDDFEEFENVQLDGTLTDYVRRTRKGQIITEETEREIKKKEKIKTVGEPAPVWLGAPLMNASGEVMGVIAVQDYKNPMAYTNRDLELLEIVANNTGVFIERVKNIEKLKKAKEKAEESDRLKSAFLANMSHEIRTPMNGILGFTELLDDPDFSGEEKNKFINNIRKSGERLLNTVNDIIDISKIETGQVKTALQEVNVNEQIENFCQFFKLEAEAKGMKLTYNNALPAKPAIIKTDKNKFGSIMTNLIKNAIKFTDEGSIQVGYETVREDHTDFLRFFVKDTGIGIPASRQEAIFNRFVQADIGNTRALQGSGLGLAISKSYVEMLGGKIWVESVEGNGSKFYFTLPYHNTETITTPGKKELSEKKQEIKSDHKKILIAEDEKFAIDYLSIVLKKESNEILYAKNGVEAVELCHIHPDIDVILMDIKMPVMDGYEASRKIREFNKDVIIIAQTANAFSGDKKEALEAGCNDYISKPIKKEALLVMIDYHLKKKKRS